GYHDINIDADYDPYSRYTRKDIIDDIEEVRFVIGMLRAAPSADKKSFCGLDVLQTTLELMFLDDFSEF
ncbi:MAG: hypothetical protein ACPIA8_04905, partial [Candidatus Puniceispirillaceae bacterium]